MDEIEVINALKNVVGLSTVKIEKLNNESSNLNYQEVMKVSELNESAENQEVDVAKDPEQFKKAVTFDDKFYQPTFQMQPEIVNVTGNLSNNQQFVFGSAKISTEKKIQDPAAQDSLDLLKRSIESLKNREFGNFADTILESVSKLSIEKSQQFKEIKSKISASEIDEKLQSIGFKDIELTLMEIEELLEEILSNEQSGQVDESEKRYIIVIQKLCDILSILFGQFRDKLEVPDKNEALDLAIQPLSLDKADLNETYVIENNTEGYDTKESEEIIVEGKKICKCFSMNNELDKQSDNPVYANRAEMKTAKSADFDVLEEENEVPLKSYSSLISTKISDNHLRKIQNVDDLSKTESTTILKSQSFMFSKDELPVELQTKFPTENNIVQVSSIPSIITRHYHTDTLKEALLKESISSIKSESMSTAIIEDLNDDGYLDLPKIPSSALSEASFSEWIDANTSFVHLHDDKNANELEPKLVTETSKVDPLPLIPEESLCSVLNEPLLSTLTHANSQPPISTHTEPKPLIFTTSEPQPSTSSSTEPAAKKQKRFSGCKNFVKRLLLRKNDRN